MKDKIDGPVLQQWAIDLLKSELKLSSYLNDPMCEREDLSAGIQNWNVKGEKVFFLLPLDRHTYKKKNPTWLCFISECKESITVPALPAHTSCKLSSSCSSVKCCTDLHLLKTSVQTEVKVDRCRGKVFIKLEKLEMEFLLTEFEFSKWQRQSIQNVFTVE